MSRKLSNWLDVFLSLTSNTEPSELFRKWTALSTMAAVLQRKVVLRWGEETFYPNMYVVLVGPPAARKGTAMREGKKFLNQLGITISADETSKQKLLKSLQETAAPSSLGSGRLLYHSSLTIFSRELTVFLGYDDKELISMLCDWYDCLDIYTKDTFARGKETVPNVWVNLLGATTPGQLQAALPTVAISSGFTSRVIFVYQANKGKLVIKPELTEEQRKIQTQLLEDLGDMHTLSGEFSYTPEFEALYSEWRRESENKRLFRDLRLDYYVQRRPTHIFKLSMICSAARGNDLLLSERDFITAREILHEAEEFMPQVFRGVGANPFAGIQLQMENVLKEYRSLNMATIEEMFFSDATKDQVWKTIDALISTRVCKMDVKTRDVTYIKEL